ncbi:hypothetical protein L1987_42338 [Smallanthus sonchifolius]|uniref:Uncharacterized protein n=1 Tax=Smallanthus sonchifolius TaxID=185202 RepID=A0ACB9GJ74_9ASTR|nr:hypothetical protein L1987_42338 [Smallanthus sonchifolius]
MSLLLYLDTNAFAYDDRSNNKLSYRKVDYFLTVRWNSSSIIEERTVHLQKNNSLNSTTVLAYDGFAFIHGKASGRFGLVV